MPLSAAEYDDAARRLPGDSNSGPMLADKSWGYVIRDGEPGARLRALGGDTARFFGMILLLAGIGLWLMPDSLHGPEVFGIKLAAMVMFSVFGGYFLWAGGAAMHPAFEVDLHRREIRIGRCGPGGRFKERSRLGFDDVGSVFLLRSKDHHKARLFLRLGNINEGLEIAAGNEDRLEALRTRLARDLTHQKPQPVTFLLARHQRFAA